MNLTKLFEMQKALDEHIEKEHPREPGEDRLSKKILALLVELGELANEARFFKYWSHDQEPRYEKVVLDTDSYEGAKVVYPLLEEYADGIHFFLSIGNEFNVDTTFDFSPGNTKDIMTIFALIYWRLSELWWRYHDADDDAVVSYVFAFEHYLNLGRQLGFNWEQIEQAYIRKNQINHDRQNNSY